MNIRTDFTAPEVEYFREQCNFTRQQRAIFDLRVSDHSIIEVCDILHISEATAEELKIIYLFITHMAV